MDQSEIEPNPRKQIPTLAWIFLGAVILAVFAALVLLVGRPSSIMAPAPAAGPKAVVLDQSPPVREPEPTRLD